jgi:DHA2 family multidrug resistance protein-like MFS transporter
MLAPVAAKYLNRGSVIAAGLLILTAGVLLLTQLSANSLWLLVGASFLISGGCGLTVTLGIDLIIASAPSNKAGAAAGISETSTGFGASLGVALLGCVWTTLYRGDLSANAGQQWSRPELETARNSIGAAVAQAKKLNDTSLLNHAKLSFLNALHITAFISAAAVFVIAILVMIKFRRQPLAGAPMV